MSDIADMDGSEAAPKKRGRLLLLMVPLLALLAGGGMGFFGVFSPLSFLEKGEPKEIPFTSEYAFVDLPQIVLSLSGPNTRTLALSLKIEAKPEHLAQIEFLQPRILDAFNGFLSEVDPLAFEKKGILEVMRNELATRLAFIMGEGTFNDILITEFRIQ